MKDPTLAGEPRKPRPPVGVVLAGGASRRMGSPKALLPLGDGLLIDRPLAALRAAGLDPVVAVAPPAAELPPGLTVWVEAAAPDDDRHPARGLVTALRNAAGRPIVALACDMPFVDVATVRMLAQAHGTVVPTADGRLQPLLARYEAEALPALEKAWREGGSLAAACAAIATATPAIDPRLAFNVNTPADLEKARSS